MSNLSVLSPRSNFWHWKDWIGSPVKEGLPSGYLSGGAQVVTKKEADIELPQHEQVTYQRLGSCEGVVPFLCYSETATPPHGKR